MKKYIIYLFVAMALVGCESTPADILQAEPDYATVNLSSSSVLIAEQGGQKTIFVGTNRTEIEALYDADWLDVSVEGAALTLFVDANTTGQSRKAVVDVVAGDRPDVAKVRLRVVQSGEGTTTLSEEATANCYMAKTESSYLFDASVKGNGKGDGRSNYIDRYGVEIEGAAYASLVWESTYDGDKTRSTKIIDGEPIYIPEQRVIYFATGVSEGNALVALHDAEGNILWSWHIWVSNDAVTTSKAGALEWMDRNLGAMNNTVGDIANRGMLYQWGRKEPFLPSPVEYLSVPMHRYDENYNLLETEEEFYAIQDEIEAARVIMNVNNYQTGDGEAEWEYVGHLAPVALTAPGNIDYALQHPTTVLSCRNDIAIGEYVFDWFLVMDLEGAGATMQQADSELWGTAKAGTDYKTIFDPCPVGYVMPPKGAFGDLPDGYACSYVSDEWKVADHGWEWSGGNGDYFPSSGNLDVSGLIGETSEKMLYWSAEPMGSGSQGFGKAATLFVAYNDVYYGVYPLMDPAEGASWYSYGARCYAASVRCVKEQK
ncbi:MAG: BACON domain-containing protein [Tidjanibacter sp.]|nr:BACON domain-containing protein [Tidjanibacter sp.]